MYLLFIWNSNYPGILYFIWNLGSAWPQEKGWLFQGIREDTGRSSLLLENTWQKQPKKGRKEGFIQAHSLKKTVIMAETPWCPEPRQLAMWHLQGGITEQRLPVLHSFCSSCFTLSLLGQCCLHLGSILPPNWANLETPWQVMSRRLTMLTTTNCLYLLRDIGVTAIVWWWGDCTYLQGNREANPAAQW